MTAYAMGDLESVEQVPLEQAWSAAKTALDELGYATASDAKDELTARVVARGADDRKVAIALKRQTDELTKVSIRVGVFGDEALSMKVLETMRTHMTA